MGQAARNRYTTSFFNHPERTSYCVCDVRVSVLCHFCASAEVTSRRTKKNRAPRQKRRGRRASQNSVRVARTHPKFAGANRCVLFSERHGGRGARDPTHARAGLFVYEHRKSLSATLEISCSREEALFILQSNSTFLRVPIGKCFLTNTERESLPAIYFENISKEHINTTLLFDVQKDNF